MLKTMRKNVKALTPILWIVIAAFLITIFAVWGGGVGEGRKEDDGTLAVVGRDKIQSDLYFETLRGRLEALQKEFRDLNRNFIQQLNIPQQVLEQLIQQSLLLQKAEDMGLTASNQELREKIISYPVFQRDGKFIGFEEYKRILEWNRVSLAAFEEGLKKEVALTKLVRLLTAGVVIAEKDIWENYKKQNESVKLEYVLLDKSKVELEQKQDEAGLAAYFEKNKERYLIPEKRSALFVFLKTEDLKKEVKSTDADIEKYYKDNSVQFKEPERAKVSRIHLPFGASGKESVLAEIKGLLDRLHKGEDFAELARQSSRDEKAKDGGDWGEFDWQTLPPKEREEIKQMEPGMISEVVETDAGASILKVTEKTPERLIPLDEVKPRIKGILEDEKSRALAYQRIGQLEKSARKEKSLDVAAQKAGYKTKDTGLVKKGDPMEDIDASGFISQSLFGLKEQEISAPIFTYEGVGLAQLAKVEPGRPAAFEEMMGEAEKDLIEDRQKDAALEKIRELRTKLAGKNWESEAAKHTLEFKPVKEHKREQYLGVIGESAEVDRLAFSLPLGETSEPVIYAGGYALVKVLERKEVNREDYEKNRQTEKENLLETKRNQFLQSYLTKLREEKKVKVDYNLFLKLNTDILSRFDKGE